VEIDANYELNEDWRWDEEYSDPISEDETCDNYTPLTLIKQDYNDNLSEDSYKIPTELFANDSNDSSEDSDGTLPELYEPNDDDSIVETADDMVEGNEIETISEVADQSLASITIPSNFKILEMPNVWIADTGATIHNTPYEIGLSNKYATNSNNGVTVGNGTKVASKAIGDIKGIVTTKEGHQVARVILKDVAYIPQSKFNLLSLTKLMNERWGIIGNSN